MMRMGDLTAIPIDPRDARWELWNPVYRVYLWRQLAGGAWASREYEIPAADVAAVLAWADENANAGESYAVFAVVGDGGERGLVRLLGEDPTREDRPSAS
jgi:hypothetical protein